MADKTRPDVIAFDLDGTLALRQEPFNPYSVGEPVEAILDLALKAIRDGKRTLCFTARASSKDPKMHSTVRKWLDDHGLEKMKITNIKDPTITRFYDDRAIGVVPDKGELLTKVAAEMVRKTRMVEVQDDHCPHCDHKFTEKGYPRPDFEQAEREGIEPMDADQLCPNCQGIVDDPEMSDERIENYQGFGGESMKEILYQQREKKRAILAARRAKKASTSPENVSVPGRGEEKQAAGDKLRNLWVRRGQCPECGGKPKDFEFFKTHSNAECRDCGHSFDVDAERKKQASWDQAQEKSASVQIAGRTGPHGILEALKALNLDDLEKQARADIASGKITKRDRGVKMLNALEGLRRNEIKPEELMIKRVPVLPPAFRPFSFLGTTYIPGDANELYQDLFKHRAIHDETLSTLGEGGAALTRMNLLNATRALYGYGDPVSPKLKERGPSGYLDQILNEGPKHCYSADTEILTRGQGWVKFSELERGAQVATINPKTLAFEWQTPTEYIDSEYSGTMKRFVVGGRTGKRMDLLVTPNHRMWTKKRDKKNKMTDDNLRTGWYAMRADELVAHKVRHFAMVGAGGWEGSVELPECARHWPAELFARFIGWYISEGSTHECGTIATIWQTEANPDYCLELDALFRDISNVQEVSKVNMHREEPRFSGYGWSIKGCRPLVAWLEQHCGKGSNFKRIPALARDWNQTLLGLLFDTYLKGDGAKRVPWQKRANASDNYRFRDALTDSHHAFITTSPKLFDDLMEVGFKLGICIRRRKEHPHLYPEHHAEKYNGVLIGRWFVQTESNGTVQDVQYNGHIYCVAVPNGLLVVRRNGAAVVSGNSFVQRRLLSKPIDNVGRSVITVDPDLGLDEVSIPREMAWTLAGSKVQRRLAMMGMSPAQTIKAVKDRDAFASRTLELELKDTPFILSRAPAWHKFNAVGQYARIHDGPHIAINPYITAGQNADFDGDQINVSLPVLPESIKETKEKLMASKMLFSIKNQDDVVPVPKHEQILGIWNANKRPPTKLHSFASGQEALAGMQSGAVKLEDDIEIPD
jgi:hypothetical protein